MIDSSRFVLSLCVLSLCLPSLLLLFLLTKNGSKKCVLLLSFAHFSKTSDKNILFHFGNIILFSPFSILFHTRKTFLRTNTFEIRAISSFLSKKIFRFFKVDLSRNKTFFSVFLSYKFFFRPFLITSCFCSSRFAFTSCFISFYV